MFARFFEVANVCLSIVLDPPKRSAHPRAVERITDYRAALASFQRDFPQV